MTVAQSQAVRHEHVFLGHAHAENQRRTWTVVAVTLVMMVAEIVCGTWFGSMALLADGWHMATHAGALAISAFAYAYASRHARDPGYTFGTGKLGDLAGFASAVAMALIAGWLGLESALRLYRPVAVAFDEAIAVAVLGLVVNLLCALLLSAGGPHGHGGHDAHVHRDNNLRSAYFHVLADALTSVAAIAGLLAGRLWGWNRMDPLAGALGAFLIARWSLGLIRDTGAVLLDRVPSQELLVEIRRRVEAEGDRVADLHLWRIGPGHAAAIVVLVTACPQPTQVYRERLSGVPGLSHVTIEVVAEALPLQAPGRASVRGFPADGT
jgi:cation diffusion facilitator family transporter